MSDNKKYYYLKLKDNYFERDNVKVLESKTNGYIYSLILLKLYLKSIKFSGALMMTETIPYSPSDVETIAKVIGHDADHVKQTIIECVKLDLLTVMDTGDMWLSDIQNFIGLSSTEADRIRDYRAKIKNEPKAIEVSYKCTPEIEIELKKEIETKKDTHNNVPQKNKTEEKKQALLDIWLEYKKSYKFLALHRSTDKLKAKHIKVSLEDFERGLKEYCETYTSDDYWYNKPYGGIDRFIDNIDKWLDPDTKESYRVKSNTPQSAAVSELEDIARRMMR